MPAIKYTVGFAVLCIVIIVLSNYILFTNNVISLFTGVRGGIMKDAGKRTDGKPKQNTTKSEHFS